MTNLPSILMQVKLFFKDKTDESKILVIYRFISLYITSTFYLLNYPEHEVVRKVIIVLCLFVSSIILSYLYPTYEKSSYSIKLLLVIEIIGYTLLLIPSGGLKSPFIWYSLNTILISFIFLKNIYFWMIFIIYLILYGIISKNFTNTTINIMQSIKDESNLLLSFIMIIFAIQLLVISIKRTKEKSKMLEDMNSKLEATNNMLIESIDHIKELYQSVNILANQGNKEGVIKLSFEHIKKITKSNVLFYYDLVNSKIIYSENNIILNTLEEYILNNINVLVVSEEPIEIDICDYNMLMVHVSSGYATYGILGMELPNTTEGIINKDYTYQLLFLSELISGAFERLTLEEVKERLVITEEQNRIANEIHDSVLQKLFSLSCGIFSLIKSLNKCTNEDIEKELNSYRSIIDTTMKDLRNKIYGLSWKKSGSSSFILDLKRYIEDIKKFNKVSIPLSIQGNVENLLTEQKKALYRMICEGIGNAVRHGKAKNIDVKLEIKPEYTQLCIIDDGIGFDLIKENEESKGLGIQNLYQLTEVLLGEINIESKLNNGTKILIKLPNLMIRGEAVL